MKKNLKFSSRGIFKWGLFFVFTTALVAGCSKDYDDDINRLQGEIDANTSAIAALQQLVSSGKYIQSIKANASATGIIVTDSDGTSYEIKSGANGIDGANGTNGIDGAAAVVTIKDGYWFINDAATGVKAVGTDGTNGTNGKDGVNGTDGTNGTNGKDGVNGTDGTNGTNGKDGVNGTDGTNGKDGVNGTDGVSPTISIIDGYWAINGTKTTQTAVPANGGFIIVDDTKADYYVLNVTSADGTKTVINLPKASLTVTSLAFIPTIENSGSPVIWFPSLTLLDGKPYYGTAKAEFKVNPTSVPLNWFTVAGFAEKSSMLRAAGDKDVTSLLSIKDKSKTNGVLTVKVDRTGTNATTFTKTLGGKYLSLCIKNDKSLTADDYMYSDYVKAYESDIYANSQINLVRVKNSAEINLTKCPTVALDQIATSLGSATILALPGDFSVVKGQTLDIAALLKNYITINGSKFSLDESGFEGWSYKFEKVAWKTNSGDNEVNQSDDKYSTLSADGKITAKDLYEAIGRQPLVKVTLLLPTNKVVLEKIIRIDITAISNEPIDVPVVDLGTKTMLCGAVEEVIDLDYLFNSSTGVGMSRAEFFTLYAPGFADMTTDASSLASGITWKPILANENNLRLITTGAKPGTYTFKCKFTATARPDVNITVKVKIEAPTVKSLTTVALNWENNNYYLKGKTSGSNWLMTGDLASAFNNPAVVFTNGTPSCATNVRLEYTLVSPTAQTAAVYYSGITPLTGTFQTGQPLAALNVTANSNTLTFINHGKGTKKPIYVKVEAVYDLNGTTVRQVVFGGNDGKGFPVNLVCPIDKVEAPAAADMVGVTTTLIDNNKNAWSLDATKFFNLRSIHNGNELIYKQGVAQVNAAEYGPMTVTYSISHPALGQGQSLSINSTTGLVTWNNVGEALQQSFTATVTVKFAHTWGNDNVLSGTSEAGTYSITIKPTN